MNSLCHIDTRGEDLGYNSQRRSWIQLAKFLLEKILDTTWICVAHKRKSWIQLGSALHIREHFAKLLLKLLTCTASHHLTTLKIRNYVSNPTSPVFNTTKDEGAPFVFDNFVVELLLNPTRYEKQEDLLNPTRYENIALADIWKDTQGAHSWNGLLDPINPVLKPEILRHGEFAELCYDAFHSKLSTNDFGGCKYNLDELFDSFERPVHSGAFSAAGYEVTQYLYAETDTLGRPIEQSVWIGFIAVCTNAEEIRRLGRRDIIVAWRGTETSQEWIQNVRDILVPARLSFSSFKHKGIRAGLATTTRLKGKGVLDRVSSTTRIDDKGVRVEKGFLSCYISKGQDTRCARDTVLSEILRLVDEYKNESLSVTLTGQSLGASLATLSSYDVKKILNSNLPTRPIPVTVFAFASPRVGNRPFSLRMEELGVKVLRLVNQSDVVPKVPGLVFNESSCGWLSKLFDWLPWTYFHVGVKIVLDNNDIRNLDPAYAHSLKVYLQLIDDYVGSLKVYLQLIDDYVGEGRPFKSSGRREPASVATTY